MIRFCVLVPLPFAYLPPSHSFSVRCAPTMIRWWLALITTHDRQHQLPTLLLDYALRIRSLHHTTQLFTRAFNTTVFTMQPFRSLSLSSPSSTSHSLLKVHQALQRLQLGCIEGLRHQVRDHHLGSNVLRRDDSTSSEIAQVVVLHVDVLGFYRGGFAFDLADGCVIIHVHQHCNKRRHPPIGHKFTM